MKIASIISTLLLISQATFGQHSGNSALSNQYDAYSGNRTNSPSTSGRLYLTDSSFVIQASVLTNVIADSYVASFGIAESAKTLKEANTKIDGRIQKFTTALNTLGIAPADIYVDMTTQTQISDYKVVDDYAEQFLSGFEQKKIVTVKFKNIKDLDKMVIAASEYQIYDLAKVDYIVTDINKVYTQLFNAAMEVINGKKELYVKATNVKLANSSEIFGESFYNYSPSQLYKNYTPNVSAEYYGGHSRRKELRNNTTYYYERTSYSGFDKVINPVVTEPAVEYVLHLQIKFSIEKTKK